MTDHPDRRAVAELQAELARLRRLVLLLAAPWILVVLGAFASPGSEVVSARRFAVLDEHGVERIVLEAPTELVRPTPHADAAPTPVPRLRLIAEKGDEVRIGGAPPQIRVGTAEWYAGLQAGRFFAVQENSSVSASTTIDPFSLSVSVTRDETYHDISLEAFGAEDRPEIVITQDDRVSRVQKVP